MEEKRCSKCKLTKPCSEFHKNERMATGLASQCKDCTKKRMQEYYKNITPAGKKRRAEKTRLRFKKLTQKEKDLKNKLAAEKRKKLLEEQKTRPLTKEEIIRKERIRVYQKLYAQKQKNELTDTYIRIVLKSKGLNAEEITDAEIVSYRNHLKSQRKEYVMTEEYKKLWEQINCQSCTFSPYGNNAIKCKLDEEEKEEIMRCSICSHAPKLNKQINKK